MLVILGQGGLAPGGVNFDAKVRRESFEPVDLFHAHIGGMDAFAHGLKIAAKIARTACCASSSRSAMRRGTRHRPEGRGGQAGFEELEKYMLEKGDATPNVSGRQEMLENIVNRYLDDRGRRGLGAMAPFVDGALIALSS